MRAPFCPGRDGGGYQMSPRENAATKPPVFITMQCKVLAFTNQMAAHELCKLFINNIKPSANSNDAKTMVKIQTLMKIQNLKSFFIAFTW